MTTEYKSKMDEAIFMMALDSYRTRVQHDPSYKRVAKNVLRCLAEFAIENELLDTLGAIFLDTEIQVFLEKEKRDNAK